MGITFADERINTNSASYINGYNKGVTDADGRANASSVNYKTGYNAGYKAGMTAAVKSGTATATISKTYNNNASSTYVLTIKVGSYSNSSTTIWGDNQTRTNSVDVDFKLQ